MRRLHLEPVRSDRESIHGEEFSHESSGLLSVLFSRRSISQKRLNRLPSSVLLIEEERDDRHKGREIKLVEQHDAEPVK